MSEKNVDIDPRFDPAFQRGFDQSIPIEEFVPAPTPRKPASAPPAPAPVAAPATAVVPAAPLAEVSPQVEAAGEPVASAGAEPAAPTELDSSPSRNPYLLFLAIIAVALVVAGVWLFVRSGDAFNSREVRSQGDYMSLDATIHMAPFIALLGAATAIGVVFVFATKWRRRR
jgi:hypothetical protein